jgi:putative sigma-54 modulation protein
MNISITFRHMDTSEAVTKYASGKLAKLQRFLRSPLTGRITFSVDRKKHVVEARISSGGEHVEAHETSDDMYASIDSVMDKLDRQIRGHKGVARAKRRSGKSIKTTPTRGVAPAAPSAKQGAPAKKAAPAKARAKSKR